MTARESGLNPTRAKQFERTPRQDEGDLNGVVGLAGNLTVRIEEHGGMTSHELNGRHRVVQAPESESALLAGP